MTKTQKRGKTMDTSKSYLSKVVKEMPDSGIKDFFDIANTMEGALSLGVGEPDLIRRGISATRVFIPWKKEKHIIPQMQV